LGLNIVCKIMKKIGEVSPEGYYKLSEKNLKQVLYFRCAWDVMYFSDFGAKIFL